MDDTGVLLEHEAGKKRRQGATRQRTRGFRRSVMETGLSGGEFGCGEDFCVTLRVTGEDPVPRIKE